MDCPCCLVAFPAQPHLSHCHPSPAAAASAVGVAEAAAGVLPSEAEVLPAQS